MRLGTAKAKTRMEVRGGGRKPYQQKGTGRARRGSSRSPLLVGGGVSFGPRGVGKARYALKMNKKEKRLAISTALMSAVGKMTVVEDLDTHFAAPKTKDMKARPAPPTELQQTPHRAAGARATHRRRAARRPSLLPPSPPPPLTAAALSCYRPYRRRPYRRRPFLLPPEPPPPLPPPPTR